MCIRLRMSSAILVVSLYSMDLVVSFAKASFDRKGDLTIKRPFPAGGDPDPVGGEGLSCGL